MKVLAVSVGCPCGVGPEVAVAAAAAERDVRLLLVADALIVARAAAVAGLDRPVRVVGGRRDLAALPSDAIAVLDASAPLDTNDAPFGAPTKAAGRAQLAWIDRATDLVTAGEADALVTGPASKLAIATSGARGAARFRGHTEHLAARLHAREVVMAFSSRELTTALVTTHLRLADVPKAITARGVACTTFWLADLLIRLGDPRPRVAVAALNPHAGEGGLLGDEEARVLTPGIALARKRLDKAGLTADIAGPIGAETAIRLGAKGVYAGVVTMYHDQATIPSKLLGFGEAVNVTLGLPIVRTSVDHGTGYDVAGTGKADPRGMIEAVRLAARLLVG